MPVAESDIATLIHQSASCWLTINEALKRAEAQSDRFKREVESGQEHLSQPPILSLSQLFLSPKKGCLWGCGRPIIHGWRGEPVKSVDCKSLTADRSLHCPKPKVVPG